MADQLTRVPVAFHDVFGHGAYVLSVEPAWDFERSTAGMKVPQVDKVTGKPVYVVEVLSADPQARQKTAKVKIAADHQPVPPEVTPGTPFRPVEFDGLAVTPYVDRDKCTPPKPGEAHRCKARQAFSLWATGMHTPTGNGKPTGQAHAQPQHAVPKGAS
jgi:hypothetical protein